MAVRSKNISRENRVKALILRRF